jgi:hypothetical protein
VRHCPPPAYDERASTTQKDGLIIAKDSIDICVEVREESGVTAQSGGDIYSDNPPPFSSEDIVRLAISTSIISVSETL